MIHPHFVGLISLLISCEDLFDDYFLCAAVGYADVEA